jgi:hypothetical protein
MPLPVATRNVHIEIVDPPTGTAAVGTVRFRLPYALHDATDDVTLAPADYTATLSSGEATIALPVNDEAGVTPTGWSYEVQVRTTYWSADGYIAVPSGGSTLEFADLFPSATPTTVNTYATVGQLSSHEADTTSIHGIADTSALLTLAAANALYLALTGGTLTGDLVIQGSSKAYRFRRGGSALDLEATGVDLLVSNWSGTNFNGTQRSYDRYSADALNVQHAGKREFVDALYGSAVHTLDPTSGGRLGFYSTAPIAKPTVTGSRGGNAALASLLTALANLGLVTDSTTA